MGLRWWRFALEFGEAHIRWADYGLTRPRGTGRDQSGMCVLGYGLGRLLVTLILPNEPLSKVIGLRRPFAKAPISTEAPRRYIRRCDHIRPSISP